MKTASLILSILLLAFCSACMDEPSRRSTNTDVIPLESTTKLILDGALEIDEVVFYLYKHRYNPEESERYMDSVVKVWQKYDSNWVTFINNHGLSPDLISKIEMNRKMIAERNDGTIRPEPKPTESLLSE